MKVYLVLELLGSVRIISHSWSEVLPSFCSFTFGQWDWKAETLSCILASIELLSYFTPNLGTSFVTTILLRNLHIFEQLFGVLDSYVEWWKIICNTGTGFSRKIMTITWFIGLVSGCFCFNLRLYLFVRTFFLLVITHTELSGQLIVFPTALCYWELSC